MQYFGESWGAPINETSAQAPTPVGEPCEWCTVAFADDDRGVIIHGSVTIAYHRECFLCHAAGGSLHHLRSDRMRPEEIRRSAIALWETFGPQMAAAPRD